MTFLELEDDLHDYCQRKGLAVSTVCVRSVNDSRYMVRHAKRIAALQRDEALIRNFMKAHPITAPSDGTKR